MQLSIKGHLIRACPGHRMYMPVKFYSDSEHRYLTIPMKDKHVLLTTCNDHIHDMILTRIRSVGMPAIKSHEHPILVPRAIADHLGIDMVVLMNIYCDLKDKEEVFELYYAVSTQTPLVLHREFLINSWDKTI
jgi:hypothetical protein